MQAFIDGAIWSRCEVCGEWFHETSRDGIGIDGTCAEVLEGTNREFYYCSPKCAAEDGWLTNDSGGWVRRAAFQVWSHEQFVYEGAHGLNEPIAELTVGDVLSVMYTLGIELTDENLENAISEINWMLNGEFYYDIERFIDGLGLKRREQ